MYNLQDVPCNLHRAAPAGRYTASGKYTAASFGEANVGLFPDVFYATSKTEGCAAFMSLHTSLARKTAAALI